MDTPSVRKGVRMYSRRQREEALDLWFEMAGEMSMSDFVAELGYPSDTTLSAWARADPRFDPDKAQHRSKPVLDKLQAIRRVAEGASYGRAARESGLSKTHVANLVRMYAEGGTAALLPKPRRRAVHDEPRRKAPDPYLDPPDIPDELPDDPAALKAIVAELRLDNAVLREVLDVLKADPGCEPPALTNGEKAEAAARLAPRFGAAAACRRLGLARSSYYYARSSAGRPDPREALAPLVVEAFEADGESARGYRFVREAVSRRLGRPVSEKVVRDVMRAKGLAVCYRRRGGRRFRSYAGEIDAPAPNLLLRADGTHDFSAAAPNEKWVSDITEFKLPCGSKVYLSPVIDLFDGKPVAWSAGRRPDAELANSSLRKACASLPPGAAPLVHTDRGCHYRWEGWKGICRARGLERSMSRKGRSPDNAACEGFFGRLKNEFFHGRDWSGTSPERFIALLDAWMLRYSSARLREWRDGGGRTYDTIDGRRRRLGLAA